MKYMGSKAKVARYIVPIIQEQIERSGYETYLEPTATTTRNGTQAMSVLWLRIMADFSTAATLARLRQPEDSGTIRTRAGATSRRSGTS